MRELFVTVCGAIALAGFLAVVAALITDKWNSEDHTQPVRFELTRLV